MIIALQMPWRPIHLFFVAVFISEFPIPSRCDRKTATHFPLVSTLAITGREKFCQNWPCNFADKQCHFQPNATKQDPSCQNRLQEVLAKICQTSVSYFQIHCMLDNLSPKIHVSKYEAHKSRQGKEYPFSSRRQNKDLYLHHGKNHAALLKLFQIPRKRKQCRYASRMNRRNNIPWNCFKQKISRSLPLPYQSLLDLPSLETDLEKQRIFQTSRQYAPVKKHRSQSSLTNQNLHHGTAALLLGDQSNELLKEPIHSTILWESNADKELPSKVLNIPESHFNEHHLRNIVPTHVPHSNERFYFQDATGTPVRNPNEEYLQDTTGTLVVLTNEPTVDYIDNEHAHQWDEYKLNRNSGTRKFHSLEDEVQRETRTLIITRGIPPDGLRPQHIVNTHLNLSGLVISAMLGPFVNRTPAITKPNGHQLHEVNGRTTGIDKLFERRTYKRLKRESRSKRFTGFKSEWPFSCRDKCGIRIDMPCSCAPNCLVYGNCCENFEEDCPETAKAGKTRYADFLDLGSLCTTSDVIVVNSCRLTNYSFMDSNTSTPATIKDFIRSRSPIYDTFTELIFMNETIYNCNKYPESNGIVWGMVKFDVTNSETIRKLLNGTLEVGELSQELVRESVSYSFRPHPESKYGGHNCFHKVKQRCTSGLQDDDIFNENKKKCETFTSYVGCNNIRYANYYCMKCSNLFNEAVKCAYVAKFEGERTTGGNALSMLVSLSTSDKMVIELDGQDSLKKPWKSLSCGLNDGEKCNVNDCPSHYKLSANNTCDRQITASMHIHPPVKLHTKAFADLPGFIMCRLIDKNIAISTKPYQNFNTVPYVGRITITAFIYLYLAGEPLDYEGLNSMFIEILNQYFGYLDNIIKEDVFAKGPIPVCGCITLSTSCDPDCEDNKAFYLNPPSQAISTDEKCFSVIGFTSSGCKGTYGRDIVLNLIIVLAAVKTFLNQ